VSRPCLLILHKTPLTLTRCRYNSFDIGLFGLLGIIGALLAPQWGRLVDRVVPWLGQLLGCCTSLSAMIVALGGADKSIGAVAVAIVLYDMGQQLTQVSSGYRVAGIDPKARARLNGCVLLCIFAGQVSGSCRVVSCRVASGRVGLSQVLGLCPVLGLCQDLCPCVD
jgi:hypothetical protein